MKGKMRWWVLMVLGCLLLSWTAFAAGGAADEGTLIKAITFGEGAVLTKVEDGNGNAITFEQETLEGQSVLRMDYAHTGVWETLKLHLPTAEADGDVYRASTHVQYDLIFPKEAVENSANADARFWTVVAHPNNGWWKDYGEGQTYSIQDMQPFGENHCRLTVRTHIEESTRGASAYTGGDFYIQATDEQFTLEGPFYLGSIAFYAVKEPVETIALNRTELSVAVGGEASLTTSITPDTAYDKGVTWSSSDPDKAAVSPEGLVTGVAEVDEVILTATANDGSGVAATCRVKVTPMVLPTSLTLDSQAVTLVAGWGETAVLTALVGEADATIKSVTWTSSDEGVAKVRNGVVTAIGEGTATIRATADGDKSGNLFAECTVAITPKPDNTASSDRRIRASGTKLVVGPEDKTLFINGTNTPWHDWDEFGNGFDEQWWDSHLKDLRDNGVNAIRVWLVCSGDKGIQFDDEGYVTGMSEAFWSDVGKLFGLAEKHEIYVMATAASFDCFIADKANFSKWQAMIRDSDKIDSYVENYLIPLVNRFGANPYFWSVDFCNEIDWIYERADCNNVPWENISEFFARAAVGIHQNSQVLVTAGMAMTKYNTPVGFPNPFSEAYQGNKIADEVLQSYFTDEAQQALAFVDFYASHYYEWECPWFGNPFMYEPEAYGLGGKPALIGELPALGSGWNYMYADESTNWAGQPSEGAEVQTLLDDYQNALKMGYAGLMPWTSNGVDNCGGFQDLIKATKPMAEAYPELIRPLD